MLDLRMLLLFCMANFSLLTFLETTLVHASLIGSIHALCSSQVRGYDEGQLMRFLGEPETFVDSFVHRARIKSANLSIISRNNHLIL